MSRTYLTDCVIAETIGWRTVIARDNGYGDLDVLLDLSQKDAEKLARFIRRDYRRLDKIVGKIKKQQKQRKR